MITCDECGEEIGAGMYCKCDEVSGGAYQERHSEFARKASAAPVKSNGGPSSYYDFKPDWVTLNDLMEHKAKTQWGAYSLHLKDSMKAGMRFGAKDGTSVGYDARKMVYSDMRLLIMAEGKVAAREYLKKLLDDPQFK